LANAGPTPLLWISGDLRLDGDIAIGATGRPVVLVVDGDAHWRGAVTMHGLLYARDSAWGDTPATGAQLQGAAIAAGRYVGNGSPELSHDAALLERLASFAGTLVRVPGSWRDF